MAKHQRNRPRRPARRAPSRTPRRRLLVVCEGTVTEPTYLRGLERAVRNPTVELQIAKERGEPRKLVEIARAANDAAKREAKRQSDDFLLDDEVWCVFDRDEHERFDEACDMALANGFELAVSNPCFELWLILHFRENPGARHRHAMQRLLRDDHLPDYDKHLDFAELAPGLDDATRRARRMDEDAADMGEPGRNPTTSVYRLTDSMRRTDD